MLERLKILRPALADKSPLVALKHLWFDGAAARAFNDVIGVVMPWESDFTGGVMGTTVVGLRENSLAKEAVVESGDTGELSLRVGNAKARLPLLPVDGMVWGFPDDAIEGIPIDEPMFAALKHVMVSVPSGADSSGVTVV